VGCKASFDTGERDNFLASPGNETPIIQPVVSSLYRLGTDCFMLLSNMCNRCFFLTEGTHKKNTYSPVSATSQVPSQRLSPETKDRKCDCAA
jgi:hypothetical protein